MRIEISSQLDKKEIESKLKNAEIVDEGDYILIPKVDKFKVLDSLGVVYINLEDIDYIASFGNEVLVYCNDKTYVSMIKLYAYTEEAAYFMRIGKSVVVNKHKIIEIRPSLNMKFNVLVNTTWLEVNRTYYYAFKDEIGI